MRRHVVISGTGRAGTTFLVELLTQLGLDTGFDAAQLAQVRADPSRGGLERDVRKDGSPYIVKNPRFCDHADEVLERGDLLIEHVFIPVRDLEAAAESRRYVMQRALNQLTWAQRLKVKLRRWSPRPGGGLWHTSVGAEQESVLLLKLYQLILSLSRAATPVTLLHYPRLLKDPGYLFAKLQPILGGVARERFDAVFAATVEPRLVHRFTDKDRE